MLVSGQYWFPRRAGELYAEKPPIYLWLTALAIALTGSVRAGFLLPSLLAAMGTLLLVADLSRRLYGERIACLAVVALLASVQFVLQAKAAQIDMVLTFFTTLASYGLLRHALLGPAPGWWLISWGAMGIGILVKGVGFLPLFLLAPWIWLARQRKAPTLSWTEAGQGMLVMIGVVALWGLPMILMSTLGSDAELANYRDNILFKQTGQRYAASWHHLAPWHYYLVKVIPWAWMPLLLAFPWAAPACWRRIRRGDARIALPLVGVLLIVVFFSLSPGKRGVYLLPTLPLLTLAMAPLLPGLLRRRGLQAGGGIILLMLGSLFAIVGGLGLFGHSSLVQLAARHEVAPWYWWCLLGVAAGALLAWLRLRRGMVALVVWMPIFWIFWSTLGYLELDGTRSPRDLMHEVAAITGPGAWVAMPNYDEEFVLQARQPMVHFGYATPAPAQLSRAFAWIRSGPRERWMLIEQDRREDLQCATLERARDLGFQNGNHWWLIPGEAFDGCGGDENAAPLFIAPTTTAGRQAAQRGPVPADT